MIINPLFIKPENPDIVGETVKSKFSNSSYLFSDIIKIVGYQDDEQMTSNENSSTNSSLVSSGLVNVSDINNSCFTKTNILSVNNIVKTILKQNGINSSDDPTNYQILLNGINKLASKGNNFKINVPIKDKNITINITHEPNDFYDQSLTTFTNPNLNNKTTSSINCNIFNPITVLSVNGDLAKSSLSILPDIKGLEENNSKDADNVIKNGKEKLIPEEDSDINTDSAKSNVFQIIPLSSELINTIITPNSAVSAPIFNKKKEIDCPAETPAIQEENIKTLKKEQQNKGKIDLITQDLQNNLINNNEIESVKNEVVQLSLTTNKEPENNSTSILGNNNLFKSTDISKDIVNIMEQVESSSSPKQTVNQLTPTVDNTEFVYSPGGNSENIITAGVSIVVDNNLNASPEQIKSPLLNSYKANNNYNSSQLNGSESNTGTVTIAKSSDDVAISAESEKKDKSLGFKTEFTESSIINNSGKIISDNDLKRIVGSGLQYNNPIKLYTVNIEITDNSSNLKPGQSLILNDNINKAIPENNNNSNDLLQKWTNNSISTSFKSENEMGAISTHLFHEKPDYTPYEQSKLIQRDIAFQSTSNVNKFSFPQYDKSNINISILPESENIKSVDQKGSDIPELPTQNVSQPFLPDTENIVNISGEPNKSVTQELPTQNVSEILLPDAGQSVNILSEQSKVVKIDIPAQRVAEKLSASTNNENITSGRPEYLRNIIELRPKVDSNPNEKLSKIIDNTESNLKNTVTDSKLNDGSSNLTTSANENIASPNSDNNVHYIEPDLETDLINQQIHSSVNNPIVLSNNSPLEIRIANDRKVKGQTFIVTNKISGRNSNSQQNLKLNTTDNNIKHLFSKSTADESPKISEDNDNISLSVEHKADKKSDDNIVANIKIDSGDFSGNSTKQNEIENNSNNNNPQNENSDSLDATKSNLILVNSGEPIKDVIQKNTNDSLVDKNLVPSIQSSVHIKGIEMAPLNNIKSSAQMSNDTVQSNFSKVKAEDLVKEIHKVLTNDDSKKVILNLQPEDLGKVKIEFDIKEKSMNARISVETESAKNLIQSNSETLRNSLHESGITLSSFNVLLSDGSRQQHVPTFKKKIQKNESLDTHVEQVRPNRRNLGYNTYEYLA